jgi:hypothetical protein
VVKCDDPAEKAALVREAGADEAMLYTEVDFVETVFTSFTVDILRGRALRTESSQMLAA